MGVPNKRTITKTRNKTRDVDQIKADLLSPKHLAQWKDTKAAEDLPGLGRHYCVEVKQLKEEPYSQKEAEAAVGLRTDNGKPEKAQNEDVAMA
ncbi:uncharacterized protein E0L32_009172 [Thyridium curvatum]|uniref:Uncharacterized protein n=1 Tax=Thyridium curvatum TaxID=1093900 RepID=A0A507AXB8_9PEZI|nr:uncharacterized protein E0L32_009172 [Thyridium curvatum]TPX09571.1 hypothetical protein E0L32_009172 [Thyridium curvatum]